MFEKRKVGSVRRNPRRRNRKRGSFGDQVGHLLKNSTPLKIFALCLIIVAIVFLVGLIDAPLIDAFLVDAKPAETGESHAESDALIELGIHGVAAIAGTIVVGFLFLALALGWIWYRD